MVCSWTISYKLFIIDQEGEGRREEAKPGKLERSHEAGVVHHLGAVRISGGAGR